jgi:hypothetical protein
MKKLRLLHVVFDTTIEAHEIAAFRGAIVEKVGRENIIFHNHLSNTEFVNNYPLIQYKRVGRKPSVFCLEQGVDEMYRFFVNKEWNMMMAGRELNMKVSSLNLKDYTLRLTPDIMKFRISNWLALNSENYAEFDKLSALSEKIEKLETILTGNILSFAKGINWTIDQQILLKLSLLSAPKVLKYKGVGLTGFDAEFSVNMFLPNYLGLGKGVSHGFGTIKQI